MSIHGTNDMLRLDDTDLWQLWGYPVAHSTGRNPRFIVSIAPVPASMTGTRQADPGSPHADTAYLRLTVDQAEALATALAAWADGVRAAGDAGGVTP